MKHTLKYLSHHMSLIGIAALGLWGIVGFSYDPAFQSAVVLALSVAFVWWGIVHHWLHEGMRFQIIFEYVAVAVLGAVVLLSIIWSR